MADYSRLLSVALGSEPADLVIRNVMLLNVVTRDIYPATIGICEDLIAYVTTVDDIKCEASVVIDGSGMWASPGFIDSHMHIESTHVTPEFFAAAVVPHGVTTVAQDPHEMANVLGVQGVAYMRDAGLGLPLRILTFVSTCVPAVPGLETSGAYFDAGDIEKLLENPDVIGLAEVMDYWGVIRQTKRTSEIVQTGLKSGKIITGHIRGLGGRELNTYLAAGVDSDHEVLSPEGILYRSRLGMTVEISCSYHRDNIAEAVESWKRRGHLENVVFVTDDVPPHELVKEGHLDRGVRRAIQLGMSPVDAVRAATLAPARRLRRLDLGQIAPGRIADIVLISNLEELEIDQVIVSGKVVAQKGRMIHQPTATVAIPPRAFNSVHLSGLKANDFLVRSKMEKIRANILTQRGRGPLEARVIPFENGELLWRDDPSLALASVWHRHGLNQNHSCVLIAGTGLNVGALATTYAHDSHNLVVLGRDPGDMAVAAQCLIDCGGGYAAAAGGEIKALIRLPVAGMLAEEYVESLGLQFENFIKAAGEMGVEENPIGLLTSLPLPVVPNFRPTDLGLVDVNRQVLIPAFETLVF